MLYRRYAGPFGFLFPESGRTTSLKRSVFPRKGIPIKSNFPNGFGRNIYKSLEC